MKFDLTHYILIFTVVSFFSFIITPLFRKIARKAKLMDNPGGRKLQAHPVAYLGGLAIAVPVTLLSSLILWTSIPNNLKINFVLGFIIPSIAIAIVGLLDDLYQLPPLPRFVAQSGVAVIASIMLSLSESGIKLLNNAWLNGAITTFWIVVIINALNFMDNMDGLATILSMIISISFFILSYLNSQFLVAALCIAIFAACSGFLFWNKRPASIYLGDAGALYLGFLLAAISIRVDVDNSITLIRVLVPILIIAIPLIDIVQVVVSRLIKRKSPFQGGRDHLSHLLLNKKLSESKVLLILISISVLLSFCGIYLAIGI